MPKRKRNNIPQGEFTATIENLSHDGRGITHLNGKTTFIFGALPGESVQFRYTQVRGKWDEGTATQILSRSEHRTDPKCPHFGVCGGCSAQHLSTEFQLAQKQAAFLELIQHSAHVQPNSLLEPLRGDRWGYRRKARLGVRHVPGKGKVLVGFRERAGRYLANLESCDVLHPSVGKKIAILSEFLYTLDARDNIPQLEIAVTDETTALIIRHLEALSEKDQSALKQLAEKNHFRIYLQPKGPDSIHLFYPENDPILLTYQLDQHQLTFDFHPTQFTQINESINQQMIPKAIELLELKKTDRVLDLFCGIGNFTLPLALNAQHVIGVEGDESAVQQAIANAQKNNISNAEFHVANLLESIDHLAWSKQSFDKILLDPPRSGAENILQYIPQWKPKRIVYVSCNPSTLARDANTLITQGYQLEKAGVMDMFPHTSHVEVISLFTKK